ncbi:MAG: rRNA maturation RNase YbeY [Phycisphaerales bacterium JB047]
MDEPDRSSKPPQEADDQPPPSLNSRRASCPIELDVFDATRSLSDDDLRTLTRLTQHALAPLPNKGSVRVRIVGDEEMISAHDRFSGLATTTDVLTFDLAHNHEDFQTKTLDTDLIICLDEARRQSSPRPHTAIHELLLYIIHGVLHCLGYDDHDDQAYTRMHAREDELLTNAGIGAIFNPATNTNTENKS